MRFQKSFPIKKCIPSVRRTHSLPSTERERDYKAAIACLNTVQSNFDVVNAIRQSGLGMNKQAIPEMIEWCRKIGYKVCGSPLMESLIFPGLANHPKPGAFDSLEPIHIAGTKGKGSTSAMVSSILSQYKAEGVNKVGLYTSPHLRFVRERIQINNEPLSESSFAKYFFEVWDALEDAARKAGHPDPQDPSTKPVYFRLLTLMALHTYLKEQVDTAIIECGVGGEYDSTNIFEYPSVTGVTSLGIDHTAMLGDTIEQIAWHKGGIFKEWVPAYTVPQPGNALEVLKQRAKERYTHLYVVEPHPGLNHIRLGLDAEFQKTNASLAIYLAADYLSRSSLLYCPHPSELSSWPLPHEFVRGLEQVRWPGRCEIRREQNLTWYIDGAHTGESIAHTASWFASRLDRPSHQPDERPSPSPVARSLAKYFRSGSLTHLPATRILIFNQQTRAAAPLLQTLYTTICSSLNTRQPFTHVLFCTNMTFRTSGFAPDLMSSNVDAEDVVVRRVQWELAAAWREMNPDGADVEVVGTIEEAVMRARALGGTQEGREGAAGVLVTGSLHLVGGLIDVLESSAGGDGGGSG
ncbi:MAG: Folylpolyglutamate synthetase [Bathelium mastoideum]|nr:MAG: Folylpolyglutamate synthetase [Bathelium mastoideum]